MFPSTKPPVMSFQRAPAETQKRAAALWSFCIYILPQHLFHSLWMQNLYKPHFYWKNLPFGGSVTCMNICRGLNTWGSLRVSPFSKCFQPICHFPSSSFFLVSGWCTQYWAIITREGWKLQLEKRAQDMIPPHRMPGRCHWNSLSLSATRVEPIWTPSKVLKTPLFIITVKWWDIVYPDCKINSHLQNACLTVLNVIWFLFKCKMKLGSQ